VYNKRNVLKWTVGQTRTTSTKSLCEIYEIREIQFLCGSFTRTYQHNKNGFIIQFYEGRNYTRD